MQDPSTPTPSPHDPTPRPHVGERVQSTATGELLKKLATAPKLDAERFLLEGELGRGGMGLVLRVHDRFLNRRLAMKVLLERSAPRSADEQRMAHQLLGRFLEEAQVTSQLDHPGVVPVHELGLDQTGKVYFTMRMVKGRTASEAFDDAFHRRGEWDLTRALEVILKVCDTMAYAHDKGVVHRDLKPANVMVGRFGEVYVMDWGLAKLLGQQDRHDLRIRAATDSGASRLETARTRDADSDPDDSVVSMDGQQLGTPSYMSPEQARSEELDARADVYSIGAMLYELVAGRPPYALPGVRQPAYRILAALAEGPPRRIEDVAKDAPAELAAVVDKAMARERDQRYASVQALAADLRALLAQRVVTAYRTGAWQETKLWVRRNKPLAASLAAAALLLVGGVVVALLLRAAEAAAREDAVAQQLLAEGNARAAAAAETAAKTAQQQADAKAKALAAKVAEFDQLAMVVDYERLTQEELALRTAYPDQLVAIDGWLRRAEGLIRHEGRLRAMVDAVQQAATRRDDSLDDASAAATQFLARSMADLVGKLPKLAALLPVMTQRQRWAQTIGRLTLAHPNAAVTWATARAAIAASPRYRDQELSLRDRDVWGLVPIGENPQSGLWEFYDLRSAWDGATDPAALAQSPIPTHGPDGRVAVTGNSGIVWALLPGGALPAGTPAAVRPSGAADRRTVRLDPFFLAKHEVTQGQWRRATGANPSVSAAANDLALPVENVTWFACRDALERVGLALPSQLQWEYAIRGGTTTAWWTGDDERAVLAAENLSARTGLLPVGSRSPNPFGLFDMGGNVSEWCQDDYGNAGGERPGDGRRPEGGDKTTGRSVCGSSCSDDPQRARSDFRIGFEGSDRYYDLGVRAVRAVRR